MPGIQLGLYCHVCCRRIVMEPHYSYYAAGCYSCGINLTHKEYYILTCRHVMLQFSHSVNLCHIPFQFVALRYSPLHSTRVFHTPSLSVTPGQSFSHSVTVCHSHTSLLSVTVTQTILYCNSAPRLRWVIEHVFCRVTPVIQTVC